MLRAVIAWLRAKYLAGCYTPHVAATGPRYRW